MRILIVGAGAVGGYFGAKLARAGNDVVFAARGANLAALLQAGVRVESVDGDFAVAPVQAVATAAEAGPCDVVLICVKSYDTRAVAETLGAAVRPDTIVLSLQNGIENEAVLEEVLGLPAMLAGLAQIGAELVAPGVIRHDSGGRIIFGDPDGQVSPRATRLAALFSAASIPHRFSTTIAVAKWSKLAWNAAFNAVCAISGETVGGVLRRTDGEALVREAMREVAAVARANGIAFDPARIEEEIAHSRAELGHLRPSTLQDRARGARLEHDALNGAVVRAAARAGVAAPINATLCRVLDASRATPRN